MQLLITRPHLQAQKTLEWFEQHDVDCFSLPLLDIAKTEPNINPQPEDCQHTIFISANAVFYAREYLPYWKNREVTIWAIGEATAQALKDQGMFDVIQAQGNRNSEALLAMDGLQNIHGQKIVIYRGQGGRQHLADVLTERGAQVDYCELYSRQPCAHESVLLQKDAFNKWRKQSQPLITMVLSVETLQAYSAIAPDLLGDNYLQVPLLIPSERIKQAAQAQGYQALLRADYAHFSALKDALGKYLT